MNVQKLFSLSASIFDNNSYLFPIQTYISITGYNEIGANNSNLDKPDVFCDDWSLVVDNDSLPMAWYITQSFAAVVSY